jgi:hypothetical protein
LNERRGRPTEDIPTFYRMNSRRALCRQFGAAGFEQVHCGTIEVQPNYLTFSTPTFLVGAAYERMVNSTEWLAPLRVCSLAVFRKAFPKGDLPRAFLRP